MEFRLLGPVELRVEGQPVALGGQLQRALLAVLLVHANRVVATDRLIVSLWGSAPPKTARGVLQNQVWRLRRVLAAGGEDDRLLSRPPGYLLRVDPGELDLEEFGRRADQGRAALAAGQAEEAGQLLASALELWRGRPMEDVEAPPLADQRARLEERRLVAVEDRIEADLARGRHAEVVAELEGLVAEEPLRERRWGQLMLARYRLGRQADALEAYRTLRARLVDRLGIEPSPELHRLEQAILRADPSLDAPEQPPARPEAAPVVPAQLPADVAGFVGRGDRLRELDALLPEHSEPAGTAVPVGLIAGTAGIGKTALAVHWAHRVAGRFPDGQLYVDLRGFSATPPLHPVAALRQLLHALGVDQVPAGLDEAAGLYRSVVAGRRLLILLDNAVTAEQVRPLLPGAPGCLVVVTSRDRLAGLVAGQGARRLVLDPLSPGEAEALLADVVGAERVGVEAEAAADLAGLCAHLPLALRIAAANLADDPHRRVAAQVAALREGDRLAALEIEGDPHNAVRAAFDVSYQRLAPPERHLFWLLGLVPGPDFTAAAAAALAATNPEAAERTLGRLAAAHLVDRYGPGRYRLHDLLRLYAAERSRWDGDEGSRRTAAGRLLDHYLHTTDQAARLLYPHGLRLPLPTTIEAPPGAAFVDPARALEWLDAESANLFAAVRHAAQHGPRPRAWLLADALRGYFFLRIPVDDWLDVARAGLAAAEAEDDLRAQAIGEMSLGDLSWHQGHYPEAIEHYRRARQRGEAAGWPEVQSAALGNLGQTYWRSGRLGDAIEHYTESLALAGETGWRTGQLSALADLGAVYAESGMLRLAYDQFTTALSMSTEPGSMRAYLFAGLGEVCHALGRLDEARDRLGQALASFQELGGRGSQADTLRNLAAVHTDAGRLDDALDRAGEAQEIARQIDSPLLEAGVLSALGAVRLRLGEHAAALELLGRALRLARAASARNQEAVALVGLATANRRLDQLDQAIELARQALRLAGEAGYRMLEGDTHAALAEVQLALGRHDQAVAHANQALTIHRETGHRLGEARALRVLGEALEHTDAGLAHWRAALAIFTEAGAMPEARALRDLVASRRSRAVARGNATRR